MGEGPVQYFADTPAGAWAELLRHEEITDAADLAGIAARLWVISIADLGMNEPQLSKAALTSTPAGYEVCRAEARRLRAAGAVRLVAVSAALRSGEAAGFHVTSIGLKRAAAKDARVIVHFGELPNAEGWSAGESARPSKQLLQQVRPLYPSHHPAAR